MSGYIYLIRTREFKNLMSQIYKIGKTTMKPSRRLGSYPRDSEILLVLKVNDCHSVEKKLIRLFTDHYKLRKDIGSEYFEGDPDSMIDLIVMSKK